MSKYLQSFGLSYLSCSKGANRIQQHNNKTINESNDQLFGYPGKVCNYYGIF